MERLVDPAGVRNPELVESMRQFLEAQRRELSASVRGSLADMTSAQEEHHLADVDELGCDVWDEDVSYSLLEHEGCELLQIARALERIDDGRYGLCERCGAPIAEPRLRALPMVTTCLECKELEERPPMGERAAAAARRPVHHGRRRVSP
jgi:DnaK suppressor protein